jgi:hypothetical protein
MAEARSASGGRGSRSAGAPRSSGTSAGRRTPPRADAGAGAEPAAHQAPAGGHVCPVAFCPVGMALTFAEAARPEVVQHLMAAGQELMLAVKAMIDARAEAVSKSPGFEHIRIR